MPLLLSRSSEVIFAPDLLGLQMLAGRADRLAFWLTHLGEPWLGLPLFALGVLVFRLRSGFPVARVCGAGLLLLLVVQGLKFGIDRPRPGAVLPQVSELPGGQLKARAMPSGHSATGAFVFAVLGGLLWRRRRRLIALTVGLGLPLIIGWSRVAIAAHWPSDVLFGLMLGFVLAMVALGRASKHTEPTGMSE